MTDSDKPRRKKPRAGSKKLRDQKIITKAINGESVTNIAKDMGMARQTVSGILNSEEVKAMIKAGENKMVEMVPLALKRVNDAMEDKYNAAGERCALAVLKSTGVLKDNTNVSHTFPEPVVIRRKDGSEIVLGSEIDRKEEE
jgi:hypothetical protein